MEQNKIKKKHEKELDLCEYNTFNDFILIYVYITREDETK